MTDASIRERLSREVPAANADLIPRMAFHIEPEISCSRFLGQACFTPESVTAYRASGTVTDLERSEMGDFIVERLRGGLFVDVPCGLLSAREPEDFDVTALAAALGAAEVWEADLTAEVIADRLALSSVIEDGRYLKRDGIGPIGLRRAHGISVATMQDELLGFVSKFADPAEASRKALYLSGIQPDTARCADPAFQREVAVPYLHALYDELARSCASGDMLILNSSAMLVTGIDERAFPLIHPAIALGGRGFRLDRRCAYDKVHVFVRE